MGLTRWLLVAAIIVSALCSGPAFAQTDCTVTWTPQNDPELIGHIVYVGPQVGQYLVAVQLGAAANTIACSDAALSSLAKPAFFCFTVTSINTAGRESTVDLLSTVCTAEPLQP